MMLVEERQRLYSIPDVVRLLSVSRATVYREIAAGRLNVVRIGGAVRITVDEVERYVGSLNNEGN